MNIVNSRSQMSMSDIVALIKSRVSIFGIYNLHDDLEMKHTKLGSDIKTANAKLEFLYRQLDKRRSSSIKKKTKEQ
jgi:hypothetical protein